MGSEKAGILLVLAAHRALRAVLATLGPTVSDLAVAGTSATPPHELKNSPSTGQNYRFLVFRPLEAKTENLTPTGNNSLLFFLLQAT